MGIILGEERLGLVLLEKLKEKNVITHFKCHCNHCGGETIIRRCKFGTTKSCGCLLHRKLDEHHAFRGYGGIHMAKWNTYKRNAIKRGIPFDVSIEQAWNVFLKQKGRCALTGVDISLWECSKTKERRRSTASLDRINNEGGYTQDNIQWVHKRINQIKMDMPVGEFIKWCWKVAKYGGLYED